MWWKCEKGHEWLTAISDRTSKHSGCPYCSGRLAGHDNSLEVLYPDLIKEWHPTKNGKLTPKEVRPGTAKKIWWICNKGHAWKTSLYHRTGRSTGCPYCSGKLASHDNNLAVLFPNLIAEWNSNRNAPLKPETLTPGSNKKVWWKCNRGHEWLTSPNKRTGADKTGCPYCTSQTSRIEIRILCELRHLIDNVKWREKIDGIEADIYIPKYSLAVEFDGYRWHLGKEERDRIKGQKFSDKGIRLLRIRDKRLSPIDNSDTVCNENEEDITIIHRFLQTMMTYISLSDQDLSKIQTYLKFATPQNYIEYERFISYLPSPPPEYSLAKMHKHLVAEWNYKKMLHLYRKILLLV